jgi:molybdate/tungstate transport system substrate-binding protein
LVIFHAASLARPFGDLEELFEQQHPGVDVVRESGASVSEARKITELGRKCDVYAAADYTVVDDLLIPQFADYNLLFLRERVVVGYTERSRYASEINSDNWYRILLRPDVKVGYANPAVAPVGWRTLLVWKLADLYDHKMGGKSIYEQLKAKIPSRYIVPDVAALEPLLESLEIDYAFVYKATAMQHNLQWVKLPDEIDLGSEQHADFYVRAEVTVPDKTGQTTKRRGAPCLYGITIVKEAPHPDLALEWLRLLFSEPGQKVLQRNFLETVRPPLCRDMSVLPKELQDLAKQTKF